MGSDSTKKASSTKKKIFLCCKYLCFIILIFFIFMILYSIKESFNNRKIGQGHYINSKCWIPRGRSSCAPQFIIAGAMKCGTTSLWSYLLDHPQVLRLAQTQIDPQNLRSVLAEKEVRFFNEPGYSTLVKEYGKATAIDYYLDLFPVIIPPNYGSNDLMLMTTSDKITGEATPMYINSIGVAPRITEALPYIKIIILLRNPIDRAYSDYWFRKNLHIRDSYSLQKLESKEYSQSEIFQQCIKMEFKIAEYCEFDKWALNPTIEDAQGFIHCTKSLIQQVFSDSKESSHICSPTSKLYDLCLPQDVKKNCQGMSLLNGIYAPQLIEWVKTFKSENLLILPSEQLYEYPEYTMDIISEYLELDNHDWTFITKSTFNIVNPKSLTGSQTQLATNDIHSNKHLQVGKTDIPNDYPPLDPYIREALIRDMQKYNKILGQILNNEEIINHWKE